MAITYIILVLLFLKVISSFVFPKGVFSASSFIVIVVVLWFIGHSVNR